MKNSLFEKYVEAIRRTNVASIQSSADIPSELEIERDGKITVHYIPFDTVNADARVVLVGITPGLTQLLNALKEAQAQLNAGADNKTVLEKSKQTGAFSGSMRPNLVSLLDCIGLNKWLGLSSCSALFGSARNLIQTTSILRYPVFVDGKNYNGNPSMVKNPLLRRQVETYFGQEAKTLRHAVFIPLGDKVTEGLSYLASKGFLDAERILSGLPHPSGANAERIKYFLGEKERSRLSVKTDPDKLEAAKRRLLTQLAAFA